MAVSRNKKEEVLKKVIEEFKSSKAVVFSNYKGLSVSDMDKLRKELREAKSNYIIAKKTIIKLALDNAGIKVELPKFDGPVGVAFAREDETAPARIIYNFGKEHKALTIYAGMLGNEAIANTKVEELAKLPNKEQMLGKLVATINAPVSGFVNVLAGNLRGLVQVLKGVADSKK